MQIAATTFIDRSDAVIVRINNVKLYFSSGKMICIRFGNTTYILQEINGSDKRRLTNTSGGIGSMHFRLAIRLSPEDLQDMASSLIANVISTEIDNMFTKGTRT